MYIKRLFQVDIQIIMLL